MAPNSTKQEWFLNSEAGINGDEGADITLFGGAAASGKSTLVINDSLKNTGLSNHEAILSRRTLSQINGLEGLWENLLDIIDPKLDVSCKDLHVTSDTCSNVSVIHCEHGFISDWKANSVYLDEAQQYTESQILDAFSRLEDHSSAKSYMKMTCNPHHKSILCQWLREAGYLDEDNFGIPKPEMDGKLTYFVIIDGSLKWGKSKDDLLERFGKECSPMTFRFISANVYDNPDILKEDPLYVAKLKALPKLQRMSLLEGAWFVTEDGIEVTP